jgi:hypothetical protein
MKFTDSAGNIAAGALIQTKHFAKTYLKGLLAPFCSSYKRYKIPFCSLQKGIRYRMQNPKIRENQRVLHVVVEYLSAAC